MVGSNSIAKLKGPTTDSATGAASPLHDSAPDLMSDQDRTGSAFISSRTGRVSEWRVFTTHTKALLRKRMIYGMR